MCRPTPANHVFDDLRTSLEEVMETFGYSNDGAIRNNGSGSVPCCPVVRRSNEHCTCSQRLPMAMMLLKGVRGRNRECTRHWHTYSMNFDSIQEAAAHALTLTVGVLSTPRLNPIEKRSQRLLDHSTHSTRPRSLSAFISSKTRERRITVTDTVLACSQPL